MASDEIYVSVGLEKYRASKVSLLQGQASLLNSLGTLHKLAVLSRQRSDLKRKLQQSVNLLKTEVTAFEKRLPVVEIPKEFKREEATVGFVKDYSKKEKIDEELRLINEKLEELNEWARRNNPKS